VPHVSLAIRIICFLLTATEPVAVTVPKQAGSYVRQTIGPLAFSPAAGDVIDDSHGPPVLPQGMPQFPEAYGPLSQPAERRAGGLAGRLNPGRAVRSLRP
jgi:hypothetical protein